jgi:hypothetical protein
VPLVYSARSGIAGGAQAPPSSPHHHTPRRWVLSTSDVLSPKKLCRSKTKASYWNLLASYCSGQVPCTFPASCWDCCLACTRESFSIGCIARTVSDSRHCGIPSLDTPHVCFGGKKSKTKKTLLFPRGFLILWTWSLLYLFIFIFGGTGV